MFGRRRITVKQQKQILGAPRVSAHNQPVSAYGATRTVSRPIDRPRTQGYRNSMLGAQHSIRRVGAEISGPKHPSSNAGHGAHKVDSKQNRPSAGYMESNGRNYDPLNQHEPKTYKAYKTIDTKQNRPSAGFKVSGSQKYNPYG